MTGENSFATTPTDQSGVSLQPDDRGAIRAACYKRCSVCTSIGSNRSRTRTAYANSCLTRCYDIRSFSARSRPSLILSKTNIDLCASRIKTAMTLVSSDYAQLLLVAKQFHDEIFCCLAIST